MTTRLRSFGASALVLLGTLLVLEGMLRLPFSPVASPPAHELDDPNALVGIELVPGAREHWSLPCHDWVFGVNSAGWRDREHTPASGKKVKIAVLGDSYMAGAGVEDGDIFSRQLETILGGDKTEVFNFGLTSIGTVQQDILLEKVVMPEVDPDIVIVGFYANDVMNNLPELEGGPTRHTRLAYRTETGAIVSYYRPEQSGYALRRWLREESALFRLMKRSYGTLRAAFDHRADTVAQTGLPFFYAVFAPPTTAEWKRAWQETEKALVRLRDHAGKNTKVYVMVVPDPLQISDDPASLVRREFKVDPPADFNPRYVRDRVHAFAARNGIGVIDLLTPMIEYRDEHALAYPYFSYTCDAHWSALGHRIAAEIAARALAPVVTTLSGAGTLP